MEATPSHERGGELWEPISVFKLQDKTSDDDDIEFVKEVADEDLLVNDKDESEEEIDENNQVVNVILRLQAINE